MATLKIGGCIVSVDARPETRRDKFITLFMEDIRELNERQLSKDLCHCKYFFGRDQANEIFNEAFNLSFGL